VELHRIPRDPTMATFLQSGSIDAALMYITDENLGDRSRGEISDEMTAAPLFDEKQERIRYFEKSGLYPINHAVVIRRSVVEEHPWVVLNIYAAFVRANDLAYSRLNAMVDDYLIPSQSTPFRSNPFRYGIQDNAPELETLSRYTHNQGLTGRLLGPSDIFDHRTLNL
jgi:4,5-dihydroxyphthalate decarboxylase